MKPSLGPRVPAVEEVAAVAVMKSCSMLLTLAQPRLMQSAQGRLAVLAVLPVQAATERPAEILHSAGQRFPYIPLTVVGVVLVVLALL